MVRQKIVSKEFRLSGLKANKYNFVTENVVRKRFNNKRKN
jgi:hypothetical protein